MPAAGSWASSKNDQILISGDFNVEPDFQAVQALRDGVFSFGGPHCDSTHYTYITYRLCIDLLFRYQDAFEPPTSRIVDEMNRADSDHFPVKFHLQYK